MDRRMALAIGLMLLIALLPSILFPPKRPPPGALGDSVVTRDEEPAGAALPDRSVPAMRPAEPVELEPAVPPPDGERQVLVESPLYRLVFTTRGARLVGAALAQYRSFAPGDTGSAQILPPNTEFLTYAMVFGNDTLNLGDWSFAPSSDHLVVTDSGTVLEWVGRRGALEVRLEYEFRPDQYLFDVRGSIEGSVASGLLVVSLGPRLAGVEADSVDDFRTYAIVTKAGKTESLRFGSLDPGERANLDGPFEWVAIKSRYFVAAVLSLEESQPRFGGAIATGRPPIGRHAVEADVLVSLAAPGGRFAHSVYVGPQEFRRLARIGHDFEDINPYGWIFRPIIRPFANAIVWLLLWAHGTLNLGYGWILILFGIAVRIVLWPLNQKAMRSSMAMQALQPQIKALQERYKQDPPRMQQELMKLYREHKVNPLGGCLPLLLPMPVLFALFFVFRETIEFRGQPFLWLPDLSRADPLYIIPVIMGISMYAVTKLGQRGMPPNPQMKMMLYFMPAFLTFVFLKLSSGLNLYYAVSNIASIPQQWLVARERMRRGTNTS